MSHWIAFGRWLASDPVAALTWLMQDPWCAWATGFVMAGVPALLVMAWVTKGR